jgi:predicted DNA-binding protein with PD1-like motif
VSELIHCGKIVDTKIIKIGAGEDILRTFEKSVSDQGIENAVILTGIGSAAGWRYHVVASTDLPPQEAFPEGNGAVDISSLTGFVLNGRIHAHITFTDDKIAFGGHLETGCKALTFVIITLGVLDAKLKLDHLDRL